MTDVATIHDQLPIASGESLSLMPWLLPEATMSIRMARGFGCLQAAASTCPRPWCWCLAVEVERLAGPEQVHDPAHRSREEFGETRVVGREGVDLQANARVAGRAERRVEALFDGFPTFGVPAEEGPVRGRRDDDQLERTGG